MLRSAILHSTLRQAEIHDALTIPSTVAVSVIQSAYLTPTKGGDDNNDNHEDQLKQLQDGRGRGYRWQRSA